MKNTTTITIHEGVATFESGEQSKSLAFFASLSEEQRLWIMEASRLALKKVSVLDKMDLSDEYAAPLQEKIDDFMNSY
jgi:hypothetical protein